MNDRLSDSIERLKLEMGGFFSKKKTTQAWQCPICEIQFKRGCNINQVSQVLS